MGELSIRVPRIRVLTFRIFQNMVLILIYLGMQSHLWPQLQAVCLLPSSQSKGFRFSGVLVLTTILSVPCNWLVIVPKSPEVFFNMESSRFKKPGFPITTNLMSSFRISVYRFLRETENLIRKSLNWYPSVESWWSRGAESAFRVDATRYPNSYFFNSTYFIIFHRGVNLDSFMPEANCSFLSISKYDLYIGIWILIGQKWQKWF